MLIFCRKGVSLMAESSSMKIRVEELESGMVTADNVIEPGTDRVLLLKGTTLDSVMIFNLKERYNVGEVFIRKNFSASTISAEMRAEIDIHQSLSTLKDVFGSDDEKPLKEFTKEASKQISNVANDLITSLYADDNILLKMHQLQSYDDYTYKHCLRVAMMSVTIGKSLDLPRSKMRDLCEAALLHDIGKRTIDIDIIRKPGRLTDDEFTAIKKHPQNGYILLRKNGGYSEEIMNAVLMHHEKFDGTGYPLGLKGEQITYLARIITVADVYDALTSNRPYRQPWSVAEAEEFMMGGANTHFDYDIITAFLNAFAPYPVGENVILSDGRHAVVISNNSNVLRPVIRLTDEGEGDEVIDLYNNFKYLTLSIKSLDKDGINE
ncbi:MAG TPA: HD-GYP domain-containing protein [Ruminococcaceae bacterium]|nr:HD-GYP domain-containing protein [Oscillospiraceae bacterium]